MRNPTKKKFLLTIKRDVVYPNGTKDGTYFYKMKGLKGTMLFGYVICLRLFGKNIL